MRCLLDLFFNFFLFSFTWLCRRVRRRSSQLTPYLCCDAAWLLSSLTKHLREDALWQVEETKQWFDETRFRWICPIRKLHILLMVSTHLLPTSIVLWCTFFARTAPIWWWHYNCALINFCTAHLPVSLTHPVLAYFGILYPDSRFPVPNVQQPVRTGHWFWLNWQEQEWRILMHSNPLEPAADVLFTLPRAEWSFCQL